MLPCGLIRVLPRPVLRLWLHYPTTQQSEEVDLCLVPAPVMDTLFRAFWTAKGAQNAKLLIEFDPIFSSRCEATAKLMLGSFSYLRGIKSVVVKNTLSQEHDLKLVQQIRKPYENSDEIVTMLESMLEAVKLLAAQQAWNNVSFMGIHLLIFLSDCYKVYGPSFVDGNHGTGIVATGSHRIGRTILSTATWVAHAKYQIHEYDLSVKYATYAMRIMPTRNNIRCSLLKARGKAFAKLGQNVQAMRDYMEARELVPTDAGVVSSLRSLKMSLDLDSIKALEKFKELRLAATKQVEHEEKIRRQRLKGKFHFRDPGYGANIILEENFGATTTPVAGLGMNISMSDLLTIANNFVNGI